MRQAGGPALSESVDRRSTPSQLIISQRPHEWNNASPRSSFNNISQLEPTDSMAHDGDAERRIAIDEQTPLLVDPESDEEVQDKKGDEPRPVSWYIWRAFWAIIASIVLGIFIKGWIDAGSDVNVRFFYSQCSFELT